MRNLTRSVIAGSLAAPLLLAAAGVASADVSCFDKKTTEANEHGASTLHIKSFAKIHDGEDGDEDGGDVSKFSLRKTHANKHGAKTKHVDNVAKIGGDDSCGNDDGCGKHDDEGHGYKKHDYSDGWGKGGWEKKKDDNGDVSEFDKKKTHANKKGAKTKHIHSFAKIDGDDEKKDHHEGWGGWDF